MKREKIETVLGELAGHASVCWTPTPTGVFDSAEATRALDNAIRRLRDLEVDAERYRWLAADGDRAQRLITEYSGHEVEALIDAAIRVAAAPSVSHNASNPEVLSRPGSDTARFPIGGTDGSEASA